MMRVFIVELSNNHHTLIETYTLIFRRVFRFFSLWGIVSRYNWDLLPHAQFKGVGVLVFGKSHDRCLRCSGRKISFLLSKVIEKPVLYGVLTSLNVRRGDVVVFNTLDAHINPHADVLYWFLGMAKKRGAYVLGAIHNTDLYGADGYGVVPSDAWRSWHNSLRWRYWKRWMGERKWCDYLDYLITCGAIRVPPDVSGRRIVIPSRLASTTDDWKNSDYFNVLVTGSMSENRIDYDLVFGFLDFVHRTMPDARVHFLGRMDKERKRVIDGRYGKQVTTFEEYVPEELFRESLRRAHLILVPVVDRRYGNYTVSGSVEADAVSYGIPVVVPDFYSSAPNHLVWDKYGSSEDVITAVLELYESWKTGDYYPYRERVISENMRQFSLESVVRLTKRMVLRDYATRYYPSRW